MSVTFLGDSNFREKKVDLRLHYKCIKQAQFLCHKKLKNPESVATLKIFYTTAKNNAWIMSQSLIITP
jgi:hypothetical protein|tara:strand:+ start:221 stop:424 length:204 start_codon:yes stop_codon:yes gene_type:complete